jgi:hypothetical protein
MTFISRRECREGVLIFTLVDGRKDAPLLPATKTPLQTPTLRVIASSRHPLTSS